MHLQAIQVVLCGKKIQEKNKKMFILAKICYYVVLFWGSIFFWKLLRSTFNIIKCLMFILEMNKPQSLMYHLLFNCL